MERVIKVRTGELRLRPGFWWARRCDTGDLTVVQFYEQFGELAVSMMGSSFEPHDLEELGKFVELLALIPEP